MDSGSGCLLVSSSDTSSSSSSIVESHSWGSDIDLAGEKLGDSSSEEEELPELTQKIYHSFETSQIDCGRYSEVFLLRHWSVRLAQDVYNLDPLTIEHRQLDQPLIGEVLETSREGSTLLVSKKVRLNTDDTKNNLVTDFIRDVTFHMLFDGCSLIPPLLSADRSGSRTMLYGGVNLDEYLRRTDLNLIQFKHLAYQLGLFAQLIERAQYVHQDLKPDNILVSGSPIPRVKVCDFGYSKSYRYSKDLDFYGAIATVSPEGLEGKVAPQSTMFSLGTILYYCLNRQFPIERILDQQKIRLKGDPNSKVIRQLVQEHLMGVRFWSRLTFPIDSNPTDRLEIERLLRGCLRINPLERLDIASFLSSEWWSDVSEDYSGIGSEIKQVEERMKVWYQEVDEFSDQESLNTTLVSRGIILPKDLGLSKFVLPILNRWCQTRPDPPNPAIVYSLIDRNFVTAPKHPTAYFQSGIELVNLLRDWIYPEE